jgi:hypothetical protein
MPRRLCALPLIALLAVAFAEAAGAKHSASRVASVRVAECRTGDGADGRSASFLGRVQAIHGSTRMGMRFTLLERFGDERRHPVDFPQLRAWHFSRAGIRDFRYRQTVTGLTGGGLYWVRVDYRWYDADGNLLRKARRTSRSCRQPGPLANLVPGAPTAGSRPEGTWAYVVPVTNAGRVTATDVGVELSVDGAATNVGSIDSIAPGETREVRFTGPPCRGGVRIVVDPSDTVKERRESDNLLKSPCPRPAS